MSSSRNTFRRIGTGLTALGAVTAASVQTMPAANAAVTSVTVTMTIAGYPDPAMSNSGNGNGSFAGPGGYHVAAGCYTMLVPNTTGTPTPNAVYAWTLDGKPVPTDTNYGDKYLVVRGDSLALGSHTYTVTVDGVTSQPVTVDITPAPLLALAGSVVDMGNPPVFDPMEATDTAQCSLPALS